MKKKSIGNICALLMIGALGLVACRNKAHTTTAAAHHTPGTETTIDSSLSRLLRPVNRQAVSSIPTFYPENSLRIVNMTAPGIITYDSRRQTNISSRVSGRIERLLVKYNYQPVKKGQLIMELYSPDLAAAQQELLFIAQNDPNSNMLEKAKQRLMLLGMQAPQIAQVVQTGKIIYRIPVYSPATGYILEKTSAPANAALTAVSAGNGMNSMGAASPEQAITESRSALQNAPLLLREGQYVAAGQSLFTIYTAENLVAEFSFNPSLAAAIRKGRQIIMYKTGDPATSYAGSLDLIQPSFRAGDNFTTARAYVKDDRFQAGDLVAASIPILYKGWRVPQSATLSLGDRSVVFKKEQNAFIAKPVQVRFSAEGMTLIEDNIEGWEIAVNAAFLVDSESFIKTSPEQ